MSAKPEFVSIGMPAYNEEESIQRSLKWVLKQTLWKETPAGHREIIVCANGCTDKTVEKVRELQAIHPEIKLVEMKEKSKALAWNRIVKESNPKTPVIFFTDADVVMHRRALEKIWQRFSKNPKLELVGGSPFPVNINESKDTRVRARNRAIKEGISRSSHLSGALYGIKRSTALSIKMPAGLLTEDLYLKLIVPAKHYAREPEARVFYKPAQTKRDIVLQRRRIELGRKQLRKMGLLSGKESLVRRARKLKGLPLKQKIARVYFFGVGKLQALNPKNTFQNPSKAWKKINSSKIPKKQRRKRRA